MSQSCVTDLLKEVPGAEGTRQFLLLARILADSFLKKDLNPLDRVYKMWYVTFYIRGWRHWIKLNGFGIQKNCVTLNTYTCIKINAHGLLLLIEKCRKNNSPECFVPWLYSSQPYSTYSTIVNYSLVDILRRLNRIQAINEIRCDISK